METLSNAKRRQAEANAIVVNNNIQYNIAYSDVVKGWYFSTKQNFDAICKLTTDQIIDRACCYFYFKSNKNLRYLTIANHYQYSFKTFCHRF